MHSIQTILRSINRELVPIFEERLRAQLVVQSKEWLIEQIIRLTLDAHAVQEGDRKTLLEAKEKIRHARIARLREWELDEPKLADFIKRYTGYTRERLISEGYLRADAPVKGTSVLLDEHRSPEGTRLLTQAKDLLFALLFGEKEDIRCTFVRVERELLTMVLPRYKVASLDFMKATTEMSAQGSWQDPDMVSNDSREDNVMLQVEYGELKSELIGDGVICTLALINSLEVNEQILYARMENIEQSTLIT